MDGKQMILAMISTANKAVLAQYKHSLNATNTILSEIVPGNYPNGNNTMVGATSVKGRVSGSHTYYYKRFDIQEAFAMIGVTEPKVKLATVNLSTVLNALARKYNFRLNPNEVISASLTGGKYTFTVTEKSLLWLNSLTVTITTEEEDGIPLWTIFPNNILDGFIHNLNS